MSEAGDLGFEARGPHSGAAPADGRSAAPRAGFRLQQFEVFNWGTFHERVWRLQPGGDSILLTGDIGSGKSTLVDALTTLLVPPHKLSYNKAAGADAHERSLRSYVLGHYKSERGDSASAMRAIALRDHNSYSVLLAVFANEASGETVTLAQVFWMKDPRGQPERVYLVADGALSVAEHFSGFGSDIGQLRKRLRGLAGVTLQDTFLPYGAEFRRRFGIGAEQALDLFNQTVSMKSVGNLTGFVREHMLEPFPVAARIAALIAGFDDLNRAHDAVLRARAQIDKLAPLAADCERHAELMRQAAVWRGCRSALRPWIAGLKRSLLGERVRALQLELETAAERLAALADTRRNQRERRDALIDAIALNGGNRIGQIGTELARLERTRDERAARAEQYAQVAAAVGLPGALGAGTFGANRRAIGQGLAGCTARRDDAATRLTEAGVIVRELGRRHGELTAELDSLRRRGSNIPRPMVELRAALCEALRIAPETLPFAGELMQVRDAERAWEGAVERVLHSFALSLLVPDVHFAAVTGWASRNHAGLRLGCSRVGAGAAGGGRLLHPASLVHKIELKPDPPYRQWLLAELGQHFDYACCDSLDEFRREKLAVMCAGQLKTAGERYEQDDRHAIDDRAQYVLGWSNDAKIAALTKQERDIATRVQAHVAQVSSLKREVDEQNALLGYWQQLAIYTNFKELDWKAPVATIELLERERQALATSSDMLGTFQLQLDALRQEQEAAESGLDHAIRTHATLAQRLEQARLTLGDGTPLAQPQEAVLYADELDRLQKQTFGEAPLTVESCDRSESGLRDLLQDRIEEEERKILPLRDAIIGAMQEYARTWPLETREVDVNIDAADEFRRMLETLQASDLPRFLARFRDMLNENTLLDIAGFQAQLQRERETVRERIASINASMHGIDYNPGRYIALEAGPSLDADLRDFQQDLRACTEGALSGSVDESSLEARFLEVKRIVERFRGREGSIAMDQRWMHKVSDVRNWFVFSASERWRDDDREHEHYTDAGGKSGGQKEKLAYTVLAAGLASQFGLEREGARSFRFAVIDEAFGRGSDDSARYGLELFRRMDMQLLVVTPLQKIRIIEPYVAGLGFVHSEAGRQSMLRYLSIGQYQAERSSRSG
jgi:uncharacterized protein YPO0396